MNIRIMLALAAGLLIFAAPAKAASLFEQISPTPTVYDEGVDWNVFVESATGDVTAPLFNVAGPGLGCNAGDFVGFTPGSIALIERGTCTFEIKVLNAYNAGASGAIIFNNVPGLFFGTVNNLSSIVAISITQDLGNLLIQQLALGQVAVRIRVEEIPLPAAAWLFLAGVAGLRAVRRRRSV